MAVAESKRKLASPRRRRRGDDLVPDEASESYLFVVRAAREGRRVSTRDMTEDEVRSLLLGDRKGE